MVQELVKLSVDGQMATMALNDAAKRNALSVAMFDALDAALQRVGSDESIHVLLLHGHGPAFCAGFDLSAAQSDPAVVGILIHRLSQVVRQLRRMPQVVVAAVHGSAIAGGCAILSGCDIVFVAADAKLGYPVHRLGISPAVTIPTLQQMIGSGAARSLLMSGELIDGLAAQQLGLATHTAVSEESVRQSAAAFCAQLLTKGHDALHITKQWINELDGSSDDARFDRPARASAAQGQSDETHVMLARWRS